MRRRIIKKFHDQRVSFEGPLHDAPLHALASTVDEAHLTQTGGVSFVQVFFDDGRDIARRECVKVEDTFDGNSKRVLILHDQAGGGCS